MQGNIKILKTDTNALKRQTACLLIKNYIINTNIRHDGIQSPKKSTYKYDIYRTIKSTKDICHTDIKFHMLQMKHI